MHGGVGDMTDQTSTTTTTGLLAAGPPAPPAERVAAIREGLGTAFDPAAFGEAALADLIGRIDGLLAETRAGDLAEAEGLLAHARDRLSGLEPAELTPRRGLAGWFDSRKARLRRFRAAYGDTARALTVGAEDIGALGSGVERRLGSVEDRANALRAAITELDAWIVAGLGWAADRAAPAAETPAPEAAAIRDEDGTNVSASQDAPVDTGPEDAPFPVVATESGEASAVMDAAVEAFPVAAEPAVPTTPVAPEQAEAFPVHDETPTIVAVEAEEIEAFDIAPNTEAAPATQPPPLLSETEAVEAVESVSEDSVEPIADEAVEPTQDAKAENATPEADDDREALARRLAVLVASRNAALRQLPLARVVQNAGWRAPERLAATAATLTDWREAWKAGLGLQGRRPGKMRPDVLGLRETRDRTTAALDATRAEITAARVRRAEAVTRMEAAAEQARRPA